MTITAYHVTGLTCEHCVRAVTAELARLDGVSAVDVDLVPGGVSAMRVASDTPLTETHVSAALAEAGDYHLVGAAGPASDGGQS